MKFDNIDEIVYLGPAASFTEMAKDLLDENEQLLGSDIVKDAKEIIDQKTKKTQKTKKAQKAK